MSTIFLLDCCFQCCLLRCCPISLDLILESLLLLIQLGSFKDTSACLYKLLSTSMLPAMHSCVGRAGGQWATPDHGGGYWSSCLPGSRVSCSLTSHPLHAATYWRHPQDLHWRADSREGTMTVDVKYGQQHHKNLKFLLVSGSGPCLMGHDWLRVVRLDWRKIGKCPPQPLV